MFNLIRVLLILNLHRRKVKHKISKLKRGYMDMDKLKKANRRTRKILRRKKLKKKIIIYSN